MTEQAPMGEIHIPEAMIGGVWANIARVSHSPFEFTIDFARVNYADDPPNGIVTARVNMSPLFVSQLIEALQTNWNQYAEKAMPPEVNG